MKDFIFTVTEQEANLIIQALAELPYKVSVGILGKLQAQANEQLAKKEDNPFVKE